MIKTSLTCNRISSVIFRHSPSEVDLVGDRVLFRNRNPRRQLDYWTTRRWGHSCIEQKQMMTSLSQIISEAKKTFANFSSSTSTENHNVLRRNYEVSWWFSYWNSSFNKNILFFSGSTITVLKILPSLFRLQMHFY